VQSRTPAEVIKRTYASLNSSHVPLVDGTPYFDCVEKPRSAVSKTAHATGLYIQSGGLFFRGCSGIGVEWSVQKYGLKDMRISCMPELMLLFLL
jgi:hypothetical protein